MYLSSNSNPVYYVYDTFKYSCLPHMYNNEHYHCELCYVIYKDEMVFCSFLFGYVWNLYKFTFLNRSEPNFAHVSPVGWKRPGVCMGPKFLTFWALFFFFRCHCRIMGTRWLPARPFSAILLYP